MWPLHCDRERSGVLVGGLSLLALQLPVQGQLNPQGPLEPASSQAPAAGGVDDATSVSARSDGLVPWATTPAEPPVLEQTTACEPSWLPTFAGNIGVSGPIRALAVFDDGSGADLYVGGTFTTAGGKSVNHIARWTGSAWAALGTGTSHNVLALAVFDDGSGPALYAGGNFTTAGGVQADHVARWNGTSWSALGDGLNKEVNALAVFDDGNGPALYAGGVFTFTGDVPAKRIARWDGETWSEVGGGMSGFDFAPPAVNALTVFDDGGGPALYAGGAFLLAGGMPASRIAKWNGSVWSPLGSGADEPVRALAVFDDGGGPALFASGAFTSAGGAVANFIASWNGTSWSALGSGMDDDVHALAVFDDGSGPALYAGGDFTSAGGAAATAMAQWNGSTWSAAGIGIDDLPGTSTSVEAFAVFDDGQGPALYMGGEFAQAGGMVANHVAQWDGANSSSLGSNGINGPVSAMAVFDDGQGPAIYVAGLFTVAGDVPANKIARWNGTAWSALANGVGVNDDVVISALAVFDDGSGPALYAGGDFCGLSSTCIQKWNGTYWSALGSGLNAPVFALTVFDDGAGPALYAGGDFDLAGGVDATKVAKWDGTTWSGLGIVDDTVSALAVFDDGSGQALYAAGCFSQAGGVAADAIARWDGTSWSALGSSSLPGCVSTLAVFDGGGGPALHAAGAFGIAKWNGTSWSALGSGILGGEVQALAVFDDGSGPALHAGGSFSMAGGVPVANIARWSGTSWSALGSGTSGPVTSLAVFDGGDGQDLYVGGEFDSGFDSGDEHLGRWGGCNAPPPWFHLGSGVAGEAGIPQLDGSGTLEAGSPGSIRLSGAVALAPAFLFVSTTCTPTPFKGGMLLPVPPLLTVADGTDSKGATLLAWTAFPPGLSGQSLFFQYAVLDGVAIKDVALSSALGADVP